VGRNVAQHRAWLVDIAWVAWRIITTSIEYRKWRGGHPRGSMIESPMISLALRLNVTIRVLAASLITMVSWLPIAGPGSYPFLLASIPLVLIYSAVSFMAAGSIAAYPERWVLAAIAIGAVTACFAVGALGLLSVVFGVPAAIIYMLSLRFIPLVQGREQAS